MHTTIFLDFDGVVSRNHPTASGPERLIPHAVARLDRLVSLTGARVVVSSTWREMGPHTLTGWLRGAGYRGELHGVTALSNGRDRTDDDIELYRGAEILAWRRVRRDRGPYVVLDDLALRGHVAKRLVQAMGGWLRDEDVERAATMLGCGTATGTVRLAA
jgi:hypothetical protein